jgi:uncharacterized membrane protein HdeD (DUF308 family)
MEIRSLPLILKAILGYFLVSGFIGLIWLLQGIGHEHSEFAARSASYKAGAYFSHLVVSAGYIIATFAVLLRKPWALRLICVVLVLATLLSAKGFAWGFAQGRPSSLVYGSSLLLFGAWNFLLGYFAYRNIGPQASSNSA